MQRVHFQSVHCMSISKERKRERERERETEENPTTVAQVKIHSRVWESLTVCGACAAESKSKH